MLQSVKSSKLYPRMRWCVSAAKTVRASVFQARACTRTPSHDSNTFPSRSYGNKHFLKWKSLLIAHVPDIFSELFSLESKPKISPITKRYLHKGKTVREIHRWRSVGHPDARHTRSTNLPTRVTVWCVTGHCPLAKPKVRGNHPAHRQPSESCPDSRKGKPRRKNGLPVCGGGSEYRLPDRHSKSWR